MREEIIRNLNFVLNALNGISVSGKNNLANLSGSIALLEDIRGKLAGVDIIPTSDIPDEK